MKFNICLPLTILIIYFCKIGFCKKDYTPEEKDGIKRLRAVIGDGSPYRKQYRSYMRQDEFLVRFLRDRNLNVENAKKKLIQTLKWRKENNIDGIESEDTGDMSRLFPYKIEGEDLKGNPLLTVPYGSWNIRRFMIRGNGRERMKRYSAQLLERCSIRVRQKNAEFGIVIIDMNGYSAKQHGCAACLPFYFDLLGQYERYYPSYVKSFYFIHTPRIWEEVSKVLLPLLSPISRDALKIYGYNKKVWQTELLKEIHPSQLTRRFGGTKKRVLKNYSSSPKPPRP